MPSARPAPVTVAQITDTHLAARNTLFRANFDATMAELDRVKPDLVVNTGDLSLDGADHDSDLAYAVECHRARWADCLMLPGNHDIGEVPSSRHRQIVNAERLARYARLVGPTFWQRDLPGWRLIGLNSQILELDCAERDEQDRLIRAAMADLGSRRLAILSHMPLADRDYAESQPSQWFLSSPARAHLFAMLGGVKTHLVLSGHVHQARDSVFGGARHIWAPATSFIVNAQWQQDFGERIVGYVLHRFFADGRHEAEIRPVPGMVCHDIYDHPKIYGS
jgi:3',5'-cyclic-AMP phosphodiesterase